MPRIKKLWITFSILFIACIVYLPKNERWILPIFVAAPKTQLTLYQIEAARAKQNYYDRELNTLASLLKTYLVSDQNGAIKLKRYGKNNDGGYVVPEKAFQAADVLLGYGIADDISFENEFSEGQQKPSYGFDCGIKKIKNQNTLFTFVNECIANDRFLNLGSKSSGKISSYQQQIKNLHLTGKNIFIKMDIEGAEYEAFKGIFPYSANITGIVLEIHFSHVNQIKNAITLLSNLKKNFILVHVHGNNCSTVNYPSHNSEGYIPSGLELTFINKALVNNSVLSKNQSHPQAIDMPNCIASREFEFKIL